MSRPRVLLLDNHDSFTWNLAQAFGVLGAAVDVVLADEIQVSEVTPERYESVVISPGPGRPESAGFSIPVVLACAGRIPLLGVCLGHQAIAHAFGGSIEPAAELVHGKTSSVRHDGRGVFERLPCPLTATRYHSLAVDPATLPASLEACAWAPDGTIMGLRHRSHAVHGVQFHPESCLTPLGDRLLGNFLSLSAADATAAR